MATHRRRKNISWKCLQTNIYYKDSNVINDLLYGVTNLPTERAFKTTYNDNEMDKLKQGIKRINSRKINH
jgi:hypothetical protein